MVLVGMLAALAGGCAMTEGDSGGQPNAPNRPPPPPLVVSAREAVTYSTTYVGLVEVTFQNQTDVWKEVDQVAVDFGGPAKNQSITIASGEDMDAWERAVRLRCINDAPSRPTSVELLGLGHLFDTLGASGGQRGPTVPAAGSGPAQPPAYPDQHLLTTPFRIPPGLFANRWILLSTPYDPPGGCVDTMTISYETSDHQTARALVPIRLPGSSWQQRTCYLRDHPGGVNR